MFKFIFLLITIFSSQALAWQDMPVHQHYVKWEGVLPSPHDSIEVEITLNEETDDVVEFIVNIGGQEVKFPESELAKLKNVNLNSFNISHGMHRDSKRPSEPIYEFFEDYINIYLTIGKKFRVDWKENGKEKYKWGYDQAKIFIVVGKNAVVTIDKHKAPSHNRVDGGL